MTHPLAWLLVIILQTPGVRAEPEAFAPESAVTIAAAKAAESDLARARASRAAGRNEEARQTLQSSLDSLLACEGGRESAGVIAALDALGSLASACDAPKTAAAAYGPVLEVRERRLPPDDPLLQRSRLELGRVSRDLGDLARARELDEKAFAVLSRTSPADDPALQIAREELGMTLRSLGEPERARELFEQVLAVRSSALPEDHRDVQRARINLATALKKIGRIGEARELEERVLDIRTKTLPDDDSELQVARMNLAVTLHELGELQASRELKEKVLEVYERTLPADHSSLAMVRNNLAATLFDQGDTATALELLEKTLAVWVSTRSADDPDLQMARMNVGVVRRMVGDLEGSRKLVQEACEVLERTRPEDDSILQTARFNLAITLRDLGDLPGAKALLEKLIGIHARTQSPGSPELLEAEGALGVTLRDLGDLRGAREILERVAAGYAETFPPDHPSLWIARMNLAMTLLSQGDVARGRALLEDVLEFQTRTLGEDHPNLQDTRSNLANAMWALGDFAGSRALEQRVVEVFERTFTEDDSRLQLARANLAGTLNEMGEHEQALEMNEAVLAVMERTRPEDHHDLQLARANVATGLLIAGDPAGARALHEKVLAVFEKTLPVDHPDRQDALENLAGALFELGEASAACNLLERALETYRESPTQSRRNESHLRNNLVSSLAAAGRHEEASACLHVLHECVREDLELAALELAPREAEAAATAEEQSISTLISFGLGSEPTETVPGWEADAFAAVESARGIAGRALRSACMAGREHDSSAVAGARDTIRMCSAQITGLVREGGDREELDDLVRQKESAERSLRAALRAATGGSWILPSVDAGSISKRLAPGEAAIGYWRFASLRAYPERPGSRVAEPGLVAFVLRRDAPVRAVDLGPMAAIEAAVAEWREAVGSSEGGRGVAAAVRAAHAGKERSSGERLRARILDPLRPWLGDAQRVVVALDDVLHLVPLDALPDSDGVVGDRLHVLVRATLSELSEPEPAATGSELLAFGGIDYEVEAPPAALDGASRTSARVEIDDVPPATALALRSGPAAAFAPLPETRGEVEGIARLHAEAFGKAAVGNILTGARASRAALESNASGCRYLHLATHGYFAPDAVPSLLDRPITARGFAAETRASRESLIQGFAPMALCGLALAGANRPPDSVGSLPGVITAEELGALDLSRCELAVLSACETNVGARRAGQGIASLQKALHAAGARSAITSLWKVPDAATKELMLDFYRRLWLGKLPKWQALWEAKKKLREAKDETGQAKYATCDWAAWVLTGEAR